MDMAIFFVSLMNHLGPDKKSFGVLVLLSVVDNVIYRMNNERHIL
jgi:hypothetical protein